MKTDVNLHGMEFTVDFLWHPPEEDEGETMEWVEVLNMEGPVQYDDELMEEARKAIEEKYGFLGGE